MTDTEKKIRLTRFLREENKRNQIRIKNREEILYGSGKPLISEENIPPVYDGYLEDMQYINGSGTDKPHSTFRFRTVLAIMLFSAVLYLDRTDKEIADTRAGDWIRDQLNWSAEAKLIDFVANFPYTLSDDQTPDQ